MRQQHVLGRGIVRIFRDRASAPLKVIGQMLAIDVALVSQLSQQTLQAENLVPDRIAKRERGVKLVDAPGS